MRPQQTAVLLVGFQNDYFAPEGILRSAIEEGADVERVRTATTALLEGLQASSVTMISTPILFTDDYGELLEPVGILKKIKEAGAFRRDAPGGATISELLDMGDRILHIPGKRGLNAFSNTDLESELRRRGITDVVMAGVVTSVCIDSTGRAAHERGFNVHVLSDCTAGRTRFEQDFYCREVFPLYASVTTSVELLARLSAPIQSLDPALV
jgi:nicotinamidase-related amidase